MVKHTETISRQSAYELFEFVYHFVWLALEELKLGLFWNKQRNKNDLECYIIILRKIW